MKRTILYLSCAMLLISIIYACNDTLSITQNYAFDWEVMPYQKKIIQGETLELRCKIVREGNYEGTLYCIRYFQPNGNGELRLDDGRVLASNDPLPLIKDEFRLYYTSLCTDQQTIDVYIEDSSGQTVQKTFAFQNENVKVEEPEPETDYSFEFETLPVPKSVVENETVEIRCRINRADSRNDSEYRIRYFQPDGKGFLRLEDGSPFVPNDLYLLSDDIFRLYYTSACAVLQTVDVYIEDFQGKVVKKSFSFTGVAASEPEDETDGNQEGETEDEPETEKN